MNHVTIFMPVSRDDHIERVFAGLEMLKCKRTTTNLLVVVDGDPNLFVKVRNLVEESKFNQRLCVQMPDKVKMRNYNVAVRRQRISFIHNFAKRYINDCHYIFGTEDDTILPSSALDKLLRVYADHPYAGMVEGVELGRWGFPIVGAWKANDVYNPTKLGTLLPKAGIEEIDAGGLYCFLTKYDNYMSHTFKPFQNVLGPDVDFGLSLRQEGMKNYIDWSIHCDHYAKDKKLNLLTTEPIEVTYVKNNEVWRKI